MSLNQNRSTALLHTSRIAHELRSVSTKAKVLTHTARSFLWHAQQRFTCFCRKQIDISPNFAFQIAKICYLMLCMASSLLFVGEKVDSITSVCSRLVNERLKLIPTAASVRVCVVRVGLCLCVNSYFSISHSILVSTCHCDDTHTTRKIVTIIKQVARTRFQFNSNIVNSAKKTKKVAFDVFFFSSFDLIAGPEWVELVCERALMWIWLRACRTYNKLQ